MLIIESIPEIKDINKSVITIGNFDGLHKGHQVLINETINYAKKYNLKSIVFTFSNHPINYFMDDKIKNILKTKQKMQILNDMGVDIVINIPFNELMTQIPAEQFVSEILKNKLGLKKIIIGHDFSFGRNKEGNGKLLKILSKKYMYDIDIIEPIKIDGIRVSSSIIRELIENGNITKASEYLGRNYKISGKVIQSKQLGRQIGFPTANIRCNKDILIPKRGIYATKVKVDNKEYIGATNIGYNPTVEGKELSVETHILNFDKDIYGEILSVEFLERIRDERKFESLEKLIIQLEKDTRYIKEKYICKNKINMIK